MNDAIPFVLGYSLMAEAATESDQIAERVVRSKRPTAEYVWKKLPGNAPYIWNYFISSEYPEHLVFVISIGF